MAETIRETVVQPSQGRLRGISSEVLEENKMSLMEPRCLVCGAPLGRGAPFESAVRDSEVCSDKCYIRYMTDDDGVVHKEMGEE